MKARYLLIAISGAILAPPIVYFSYFGLYVGLSLSKNPEHWELFSNFYASSLQVLLLPIAIFQLYLLHQDHVSRKNQQMQENLLIKLEGLRIRLCGMSGKAGGMDTVWKHFIVIELARLLDVFQSPSEREIIKNFVREHRLSILYNIRAIHSSDVRSDDALSRHIFDLGEWIEL